MKLLRFGPLGHERPGMMDDEGVVRDISHVVGDLKGSTLSSNSLTELAELDPESCPVVASGTRFGPCVPQPGKFIAIGLNYIDAEKKASGFGVRDEPVVYMKASSSIAGPMDDLVVPRGATKMDWEVELGVVIGTQGAGIAEADALAHVAGYCIVNDLTERAWQHEHAGQWVKGKSADGFGPVGPWLVTPDEMPAIADARIALDLNGERMQSGRIGDMIWDAASLVSYVSRFMRLMPGGHHRNRHAAGGWGSFGSRRASSRRATPCV